MWGLGLCFDNKMRFSYLLLVLQLLSGFQIRNQIEAASLSKEYNVSTFYKFNLGTVQVLRFYLISDPPFPTPSQLWLLVLQSFHTDFGGGGDNISLHGRGLR